MRQNGTRTIKVVKAKLIEQIIENKEAHIIAYAKAVEAYKKEALKQLSELTERVENGALDIKLKLTTPVDNRENYDKIVGMFEWDIDSEVELTQQEYNEYILDETESARHALMSNTAYLGG